MATRTYGLCDLDSLKWDAPWRIPSPAMVRATAAEIRRSWTPRQRRRRAQVAHYILLQQLLVRLRSTPTPAAGSEASLRVMSRFPSSRC